MIFFKLFGICKCSQAIHICQGVPSKILQKQSQEYYCTKRTAQITIDNLCDHTRKTIMENKEESTNDAGALQFIATTEISAYLLRGGKRMSWIGRYYNKRLSLEVQVPASP